MQSNNGSNVKCEPKYISKFLNGMIGDYDAINEYVKIRVQNQQYTMTDIFKFIDDQLIAKIKNAISDLYEKNIYRNESKIHSTKHIEDVITFAAIIGKSINLNAYEMNLLLEAAKYHDAGRTNDYNDDHAQKGSIIARESLKNTYSSADVNVIATAVAYHEVYDDQNIFIAKCKENGIDPNNNELLNLTFKISNCLKDADALDRTRFICTSKAFVRESMLRCPFSKRLIRIAEQINETYATDELEALCEVEPKLISVFQDELNKTHNPKLVIRNFRHGYINLKGETVSMDENKNISNGISDINKNRYTESELKTLEKCARMSESLSSEFARIREQIDREKENKKAEDGKR